MKKLLLTVVFISLFFGAPQQAHAFQDFIITGYNANGTFCISNISPTTNGVDFSTGTVYLYINSNWSNPIVDANSSSFHVDDNVIFSPLFANLNPTDDYVLNPNGSDAANDYWGSPHTSPLVGGCDAYNESTPTPTPTPTITPTPTPTVPTNKDQCKKDAWMNFISLFFKNQGSCVSSTNK